MNKNRIRLTESQLHRIIKESVKKVINEMGNSADGQIALAALSARQKGFNGYNSGEYNDTDCYAARQANRTEHPDRLHRAYADSYRASRPGAPEEAQKREREEISKFYNGL